MEFYMESYDTVPLIPLCDSGKEIAELILNGESYVLQVGGCTRIFWKIDSQEDYYILCDGVNDFPVTLKDLIERFPFDWKRDSRVTVDHLPYYEIMYPDGRRECIEDIEGETPEGVKAIMLEYAEQYQNEKKQVA